MDIFLFTGRQWSLFCSPFNDEGHDNDNDDDARVLVMKMMMVIELVLAGRQAGRQVRLSPHHFAAPAMPGRTRAGRPAS